MDEQIAKLENQLSDVKDELNTAYNQVDDLMTELATAKERIETLEATLGDIELTCSRAV